MPLQGRRKAVLTPECDYQTPSGDRSEQVTGYVSRFEVQTAVITPLF